MFKFKSYVFWVGSLLLLGLAVLFYRQSYFEHTLIPNGDHFPWTLVESTDSENSKLSIQLENTLKTQALLATTNPFPFANLNFILGDGDKSEFVDWSIYTDLLLKIRCEPQNSLSFAIGSFDSRVTLNRDPGSYRPSSHSFTCGRKWKVVDIDLARLETPDWWINRYHLAVSDKNYSLKLVNTFSIMHSYQTPKGVDYSYEISSAILKGRHVWLLNVAKGSVCMAIVILLLGLHQVRVRTLLQKRLEINKKELQTLPYEKLQLKTHKDRYKNRIQEFIAKEYSNPDLNLDVVMSALGLNRAKINEILKEHYDLTFSSYLTRIRMTEAARLLVEQDINVASIGYAVGYKTASYFNRSFKKEYGCAPNAFRRYMSQTNFKGSEAESEV